MKILIAVPCMDMVPVKFMTSLMDLRKPDGTCYAVNANCLIYDSRNIFSSNAIRKDYDRVLWLDSDMVFDSDMLVRLNTDLDEHPNMRMVSGLYFKRKIPTSPVIYKTLDYLQAEDGHIRATVKSYLDYPEDALFEVEGCGFGAVMTDVSLLREVWDKYGPPFDPMTHMGEDLSFCWRVRQLGEKIWCDSRVKLGHVGQYIFDEETYIHQAKKSEGRK